MRRAIAVFDIVIIILLWVAAIQQVQQGEWAIAGLFGGLAYSLLSRVRRT